MSLTIVQNEVQKYAYYSKLNIPDFIYQARNKWKEHVLLAFHAKEGLWKVEGSKGTEAAAATSREEPTYSSSIYADVAGEWGGKREEDAILGSYFGAQTYKVLALSTCLRRWTD